MRLKNYLAMLLVILSTCIYAQLPIPTLMSSQKYSAIRAGSSGVPTVTFNVPAGKDRVMLITTATERYHSPVNSNYPSGATESFLINANALTTTWLSGNVYSLYNDSNNTQAIYTFHNTDGYITEADGLATGNVTITFPNLNLPNANSDEMSVIVSVYENVKDISRIAYTGSQKPTGTTVSSTNTTQPTLPIGRGYSDLLYVASGTSSQSTELSISSGWTSVSATMNNVVVNNSGPNNNSALSPNEPDGISQILGYRRYATSSSPTVSFTRTSTGEIQRGTAHIFALFPFASPSITGNVYRDTDGVANINGTGTNAGGTYVNVIDSDNKLIYSATVNVTTGAFTIPTGYVVEASSYRLELSKNTGTIGATAPVKELPNGWSTIGESKTGVSPFVNDGSHDGIIELTIGTTNITGLRYGILGPKFNCNSGMYLSQGSPTRLYDINTSSNPFTYPAIGSSSGINYNAIGFNPLDGFVYGMLQSSNNIIRIYSDGTYTNLGAVTNLPVAGYNSGDIDNNGNYYVKAGGNNNILYKINLTTLVATLITLDRSFGTSDFAYNPINGLLYGINDGGDYRLFSINPLPTGTPATAKVLLIGTAPTVANQLVFGAMMASSTGAIFGSANSGGFYQFNITTGTKTLISASPSSGSNDGAHCVTAPITFASDLYATKTDNKTTYVPGKSNIYTIEVGNTGPFGVSGAHVSDPLPLGIPTANISYTATTSGGGTTDVIGTQTGAISDLVDLPVGAKVIYTVTVNVPTSFTGNLTNVITITPPVTSIDSNLSNNTATDTDTNYCTITASNPDSDGDGIADACDLDDDNDGILDTDECNSSNKISENVFPTSGSSLPSVWITNGGSFVLNSRGLQFQADNSITTVSQNVSGIFAGSAIILNDVRWLTTGNNSSTGRLITEVLYNGVVYATINTGVGIAGSIPTIVGNNGASTNISVLPAISSTGNFSTPSTVIISLPSTLPSSGSFQIRFTPGGSDSDDISIQSVVFNSCSDTDADGIPDYLDLDSDGDGCPDAIEGEANFTNSNLHTATGNLSTQSPNQNLGNTVGNTPTTMGVPTIAGTGQGIGQSQDSSKNDCLDSDGDDIPDWEDLDDDNDGILDCVENGLNTTVANVFNPVNNATHIPSPSTGPLHQFRLTNGLSQQGQIWSKGKVDFSQSFSLSMKALLSGADGIAIVFHNSTNGTSATGITGQGLGARGIDNGIALELDTFTNSCDNDSNNGQNCDPSYDHGSIRTTSGWVGTGKLAGDVQLGDGTVDDGVWHDVVISWNAQARNLSYTFDGVAVTNYTFPLTGANSIQTILGGSSTAYFGYTASTGSAGSNNSVGFDDLCSLPLFLDTDGDGIPNHLDLDSDGDGCPDAIEGGANFTTSNLVYSSMPGGNSGTGYTGTSITPIIQNLGNTVGNTPTTMGVPTIAGTGQTIGDSQNGAVNSCPASPSITGNVYQTIPTSTEIDGVPTNAGGTYVNVIDSITGNLVYSAIVNASGVFTVPTGHVLEDSTYRLELSKNTGTIGATAPVKELPYGWGTVGENTTGISPYPKDGTDDGTINLTMGITNIIGLRYAVATCSAGTNAPTVQDLIITCPNTFIDLDTALLSPIPNNTSFLWFTNNTHTGVALSGTQITQAGPGTYYGFLYSTRNDCYSPVSAPVIISIGYNTLDTDGDGIPDACDLDDVCYEPPTDMSTIVPVKHGITALERADRTETNGNWPMLRNSAYTALESKTKGFVITRTASPETTIAIPVVGMMVFDTDEDEGKGCLKIYTGPGAGEGWKCFTTQGCPPPPGS